MISVVVCVNKMDVYERLLLPSIKKQKHKDYEIVLIDTKEHPYSSAADALNYGASLAKGDILIFCHQDVELLDDYAFTQIEKLSSENEYGVAGVAGIVESEMQIYSSVVDGLDRRQAGIKNEEVKNVDSLDECLFVVKKDRFKGFTDYGSWHFYAVEYSLKCKRNNENVLLLPINIYHESPGWSLNKSYWKTLLKVAKEFREFKTIPTTMGVFKNNKLLRLRIIRNRLRNALKINKLHS